MATTFAQPRRGWTAVLRRLPAGRYADVCDAYEVVCCACGDDPSLGYREVPPRLQRVRGPYWPASGAAALERHPEQHPETPAGCPGGSISLTLPRGTPSTGYPTAGC
jgi:hypothetical protein